MDDKTIKQPTAEEQQELDNVLENSVDYAVLGKKRYGIGWLRRYTIRRISHEMLTCKKEDEVTSRCASLVILNGWWRIKLFHRFFWRMLWRNHSDEELSRVLAIGKKKEESQGLQYLNAIILLTGMKDTTMAMTREEAGRILRELQRGQASRAGKSTPN